MANKLGHKALLIYPSFTEDSFWSFKKTLKMYMPKGKFGLPKVELPPLGLMGLYDYLKSEKVYDELELIDRNVDPRDIRWLAKDADHIYLSAMLMQENGLIKTIEELAPLGKPIMIGGPAVDENLRSKIKYDSVIFVENEAELVIKNALDDFADKRYGNIHNGMNKNNPEFPTKFFRPDFSSIDMENYMHMALQFSRGCPQNCEFCDITSRFGNKTRYAPLGDIEQSLTDLFNLGWRKSIFISDDNFIAIPRKAIEVMNQVYNTEEKLGHHFSKYTELGLNLSDDTPIMAEAREWLKRSGFTQLFIGVETNNEDALIETHKRQNLGRKKSLEKNLKFISKETGAAIMIGMISGFDSDTNSSVKSLINFINSTPCPIVQMNLLMPLPHTALESRLEKEDRLKIKNQISNSGISMNFIPYNMSAKQAEENLANIYHGIYSEKAYFARGMKELNNISPVNPKKLKPVNSLRNIIYSLSRIFTKKYALTYLRHLPEANAIASRRFGFGSYGYSDIMNEYINICSLYPHFKERTKLITNQLKDKKYEPWQLSSYKEILENKNFNSS